jgi:hypothetical protein
MGIWRSHGAWSLVKWHKTHKCMLVAAELAANVAIAHRTRNGARLAPRPPTKHQRSKAAVDGAASLRVSLSAVREAKAVVVWANQGSAHPCVTGPEAFTHTLPPLGALFGRYNTPFTSSPFALHSPASALHTHTLTSHTPPPSQSVSHHAALGRTHTLRQKIVGLSLPTRSALAQSRCLPRVRASDSHPAAQRRYAHVAVWAERRQGH